MFYSKSRVSLTVTVYLVVGLEHKNNQNEKINNGMKAVFFMLTMERHEDKTTFTHKFAGKVLSSLPILQCYSGLHVVSKWN